MKRKWIFWLIRLGIYAIIVTVLILIYQNNGVKCEPCPAGILCPPCPVSSTQATVLVIGKVFGFVILAIELMLVLRSAIKRKRESEY